ncbi:hypothetical protein NS331_16555 [Pseudacidovorax intermedius]|uniref:Uncharacterized protein n=2 Tax=Pseudacidovorax intermedius TaxID=433924 RepID=A0A147GR97_9BURK|nr:hypothetical protein NS331_16555 [Pseudacidovorax intermedius]
MNIDLSAIDQIEDVKMMAHKAFEFGIPDSEYARVLDLAGEMLRQRRLFWLDRSPRLLFDEEMDCHWVQFRIAVSPEDAADMTGELISLLVEADLDRLPINVSFYGALHEDGSLETADAN